MKTLMNLLTCIVLVLAISSCGSDEPEVGTKNESVKAAENLAGVWVYEKYTTSDNLYERCTYTIAAFGSEKDITNVDGVPMTFVGDMTVKDEYPSWQTFEFAYFIQIDPVLSVIKAWSKSENGQHWTPTLVKEFRYKLNQDGTLSLTGEYGTEVCKRK